MRRVLVIFVLGFTLLIAFAAERETDIPKDDPVTLPETTNIPELYALVCRYGESQPKKTIALGKRILELLREHPSIEVETGVRHQMAWAYKALDDHETARTLARESIRLATAAEYHPGHARALNFLGVSYWEKGSFDRAADYFLSAKEQWDKAGDSVNLAISYNNIGMVYKDIGYYEKALQFNYDALTIQEKEGRVRDSAYTLTAIGVIHFELGDLKQALDAYLKSLKIVQQLKDERGIADNLNNIGAILQQQGRYKDALTYYKNSLELEQKLENRSGMVTSFSNMGEIYQEMNQPEKALEHYARSVRLAESIDDKHGMIFPMINIGRILRQQGKHREALNHFRKALTMAQQTNAKVLTAKAYKQISETHAAMGNYKAAYQWRLWYQKLNDEIFNKEKTAKIAEIQAKYDFEKKEKEIRILKANDMENRKKMDEQNRMVRAHIIVGTGIMLLAIFNFILYRYKKKAEAAVRESEEKYRLLVENAQNGIVVLQNKRFQYVNPVVISLLGYSEEELQGTDFTQLFPPEELPKISKMHHLRIAGEHVEVYETEVICKNGARLPVEVSGSLIRVDKKPAIMLFVRDISHQKKLEAERLQRSKLESMGLLAEGIAHDFNNLLGVILGNLEMVRLQTGNTDKVLKTMDKIEKAVNEANELVQQFLSLSLGGGMRKQKEPLQPMVQNVLNRLLKSDNTTCGTHFPHDLHPVLCNATQIIQVFEILISNSIEAMQEGGNIFIEAENIEFADIDGIGENEPLPGKFQPGNYVKISLRDTGEGIPQEHLPRIFDPYFSTRRRVSQRGLGFGLAIVYSTIKQHNGYINVTSTVNVGTTVTLYLPA